MSSFSTNSEISANHKIISDNNLGEKIIGFVEMIINHCFISVVNNEQTNIFEEQKTVVTGMEITTTVLCYCI